MASYIKVTRVRENGEEETVGAMQLRKFIGRADRQLEIEAFMEIGYDAYQITQNFYGVFVKPDGHLLLGGAFFWSESESVEYRVEECDEDEAFEINWG